MLNTNLRLGTVEEKKVIESPKTTTSFSRYHNSIAESLEPDPRTRLFAHSASGDTLTAKKGPKVLASSAITFASSEFDGCKGRGSADGATSNRKAS